MECQSCINSIKFVNIWNMSQLLRERIALNVQKYRVEKGYKRETLSLLLGCDNSYISKLEKQRVNITIDKLEQLANIFEIDAIELISK